MSAAGHPRPVSWGGLRRAAWSLAGLVVTMGVVVALWYLALSAFHLDPYFAKSPRDIWVYFATSPDAVANRNQMLAQLSITLRDASLGYLGGTVTAILVANVMVLRRSVEQTLLPLVVTLRSIPLVAMTPLIALVFGRGILGVSVVSGMVTFFPTLVNLVQALRSVPDESLDLLVAYGASPLTVLRKVQMPSAIPALFASARIAAPGALLGAILAEWLVTGQGIGNLMLVATSTSRFDTLWASVVLIAVLSISFFVLIGTVEESVLRRYFPHRAN